jgi:hypothetical protein
MGHSHFLNFVTLDIGSLRLDFESHRYFSSDFKIGVFPNPTLDSGTNPE